MCWAHTTETPSFLNRLQIDLMCAGQSAADLSLLIPLMLVFIVRLLLIGWRLFLKSNVFFIATTSSHIQLKVLPTTLQEVEGRVFRGSECFSTVGGQASNRRTKWCRLPSTWPAAGLKCSAAPQCTGNGWIYCQRSEVTDRNRSFLVDSVTCEMSSVIYKLVLSTDTE